MIILRMLGIGLFCSGLLACAGEDGPAGAAGPAGANGANGADGTDGKSSLVSVTAEPPGANCANGGQRIDSGVDDDNSGTLEPGEVDSTSYVCTGDSAPSSLVSVTSEPAGANCADGGQRIDTGVDDNRNNTLEAGEIDQTTFVCNGNDGVTTLINITTEPAGANCAAGGQRIDAGRDDNGNGTLEAAEIDDTAFVCNGQNGQDAGNIPPNAALWLRMDDDPTDGAIDSAGSHSTTCASGACPALVAAQVGFGYQFTADRLTVAPAADLGPGTAFTFAAWVRVDSTPTENTVVACKNYLTNDCTFAVLVNSARQPIWYHTSGNHMVSTTALTLGVWNHVVFTWDGTTKRGYINGTLNQSGAMATPGNDATLPLTIGQRAATSTLSFPGSIDEAVYYNRVLTQAEITSLASQ